MTPALAKLLGIAAAAFSAELLTLASPPMDQGWLAWFALVPYFVALLAAACPSSVSPALPRPQTGRAWWIGFTFGFTFLMLLVPWFGAFTAVGYPIAGLAWGLVSGLIAAVVTRLLAGLPTQAAPLMLASGWTVFEWVRAQGALAFPWGTLAATQHRYLPVIQLLDLTGAYGLSFLMALTSAATAAVILAAWRRRTAKANAEDLGAGGRRWATVALALVGISVGRGQFLLSQPPREGNRVRVGVVQASQSIRTSGAAVQCISPTEDYDAWTQEAIRRGAELVVWPESARPADVVHNSFAREGVERLVRGTSTHLLAGSFVMDPKTELDMNAAVMFSPEGVIRGQYAKVLIVPFGEYLPARPLFFFAEKVGWPVPPEDLHPGAGWQPVAWTGGKVGVSICFESAFGYVSRSYANRGANLLAVMTSDGWAGRTAAGLQHAAFAPLRAVENRRAVARAAATGVSELIDPYGRVLQSVPMFERGVAVGDLPLRSDLTWYTRLGDWPVGLAWLLLLLPGISRRLPMRRQRADALKTTESG